jgi:hypothetical protein
VQEIAPFIHGASDERADELPVNRRVKRAFRGGHETVTHGAKKYVRAATDAHSNTIEGVFSLIRRGVMGTFHSVSRKHLPSYLNEFQFRWNTRKMNDGQRISAAIKTIAGKHLEYRGSVKIRRTWCNRPAPEPLDAQF